MTLVVLAAGFTSCSNDDIPMEEKITKKVFDTTFIVDPSGVVEPYHFEEYPGHLSIIPEGAQLRLRILIYDSNGEIVGNILTQKQSNYQSTWSVKTELEAGTYTALVISDVINTNDPDVEEYWTLENYGKINDVKLKKNLDYYGYQKEILGMCHLQFSPESSNSSISLDLKPAGAACYWGVINDSSSYNHFWFTTDMQINSVFWDSSFKLQYDREISNYVNAFAFGGAWFYDYGFNMHFSYILPSRNQWFAFYCDTEEFSFVGDEAMSIEEIKAGEQYFFLCYYYPELLGSNGFTEYFDVTGKTYDEWYEELGQSSRAMNIPNKVSVPLSMSSINKAVYIKDLIKK